MQIKYFYYCWKRKVNFLIGSISCFQGDMKFFKQYSNLGHKNKTELELRSSLVATYHIIEKGLSMPNRRLGFGKEKLLQLIQLCEEYYNRYGTHDQVKHAIAIVKEYDELHKNEYFQLEEDLQKKIDSLLALFPKITAAEQLHLTSNEFFSHRNDSFDLFSESRHSMRHFKGSTPIEAIEKAVNLAKNAPSACNKQPVRLHLITDKAKVEKVLDLQQGNRGFGKDIDKVIVLTTQFSGCTRLSERYMPFIDAGIFSMNLLYALHFYSIGAIPLVWLSTQERDCLLRKMVNIPKHEIPAIIIGIGGVSDDIVCAISPRLQTDELLISK